MRYCASMLPSYSQLWYHDLSENEFLDMLDKQGGRCPICLQVPPSNRFVSKKRFSIDHCHRTLKIRALLCHHCNCALGLFKDNVDWLRRAINHLRTVLSLGPKLIKPQQPNVYHMDSPISEADLAKEYVENKQSLDQLSARCIPHLSRKQIYDRLLNLGVTMRRVGGRQPTVTTETHRICKICGDNTPLENLRSYTKNKLAYYCKRCYYTEYWIGYKYGLSAEVFNTAMDSQDHRCSISGMSLLNQEDIAIDHVHDKSKNITVRGIVHHDINFGLGLLNDDPALVTKAIEYLEKHQELALAQAP